MTSLFDKHPTDIHLILNKRCCFFNLVPEARDLGNFLYSFPLSPPAPEDSVLCVAVFTPLITGRDLGPFKGKLIKSTVFLMRLFCCRGFARVREFS